MAFVNDFWRPFFIKCQYLSYIPDTHIVSFIFNVGQKVDVPWPLDIMGYDGSRNRVLLEPGDMVYYESSR